MAKRTCEEINRDLKRQAGENKARMVAAGLTMYTWETAGDERVRQCCRKLDGKLCLWVDPTVYSRDKGKTWVPRPKDAVQAHPGELEGCRCTALAFEPELIGEL
jgi:uncharacterized protein with gpF-like domain